MAQAARESIYLTGGAAQARAELIEQHLVSSGVVAGRLNDTDRAALSEMVCNGPEWLHESVSIGLIWNGDPRAVALPVSAPDEPGDKALRTIQTVGKARIVMLDSWNGSGHDVELTTPVTMRLSSNNPARLDSRGGGSEYGWDDVAGLVHSAYTTEITEITADDETEAA